MTCKTLLIHNGSSISEFAFSFMKPLKRIKIELELEVLLSISVHLRLIGGDGGSGVCPPSHCKSCLIETL